MDKVAVSDLREELGLRPTVFYRWQKEFFENGAAAFQAQERPHHQVEEKQKRIAFLEKKEKKSSQDPNDPEWPPAIEFLLRGHAQYRF